MLADHLQEGVAVFLQLALPYAADGQELLLGQRPVVHHVHQAGVVEDDIGRHVLFVGEGLAALAQGVPQLLVGISHLVAAAGLLLGFGQHFLHIDAQVDALLTLEQCAGLLVQMQSAIGGMVHIQIAARHQLTEHRAPGIAFQLLADAIGRKMLVRVLENLVGLHAQQHVDQVVHTEALPGAVHAGQRLAGGLRAIPGGRGRQAGIAIAAEFGRVFAEIMQQRLAPAAGDLAQAQHGIELGPLDAFEFLVALRGIHHLPQHDHILQPIDHPGGGRLAVTPGTARLLIIGFETLGQVQMHDEAHIGLVDAHAEGDGGHHDHTVLPQEALLIALAHFGTQPGVIGHGVETLLHQPGSGVVHLLARQAVDDPGVLLVLAAQETQQLLPGVLLLGDAVLDVGAVEAADEVAGLAQAQALDNLGAGIGIGGRGQGDAGHMGKLFLQHRQLQIVHAEVVSPLRHAVSLVDGEQGDVEAVQQIQCGGLVQPFWSHIKKVESPGAQGLQHRPLLVCAQGGIQKAGAHAQFTQRVDLVLHEGDQGRDDDADAGAQQ